MEKKLGEEPAFAREASINPLNAQVYRDAQSGMSKRFYAACCAMQGLISANARFIHGGTEVSTVIRLSYAYADELLRQEEL